MNRAAGTLIASAAVMVMSAPLAPPLAAQDEVEEVGNDGTLIIDILVEPPEAPPPSEAEIRECEAEIDAARVTREIIVCRQIGVNPNDYYSANRADARRRYAEETAFAGSTSAPDVDGTGLPMGLTPVVTIRGCFIPPCPKDPALIVDVEALPEAPDGSDADRIAQGLIPLGSDKELSPAEINRRLRALETAAPPESDQE